MTSRLLCPMDLDELTDALMETLANRDLVTTAHHARVVIRAALLLVSGLDAASLTEELRRVTLILAAIAERDGGQVRLPRDAVFGERASQRVVHVDRDVLADEVVLTLTADEVRPSTTPAPIEFDAALTDMFGTRGQRRD